MPNTRRFLIAPSLARLLRKQQGVEGWYVEGHFPGQFGRSHFVSMEPTHAYLVITDPEVPGGLAEDRTEVPRIHAEALLDVSAGKVGYERTRVQLGAGYEVLLARFVEPSHLDVLTVVLDGQDPSGFAVPGWFGPEVTGDPAWARHSIALNGAPAVPALPLSNDALDALLDTLDGVAARQPSGNEWSLRSGS